jgi:hypothetical protein
MACAICNQRREKRSCPGLPGNICAICCGEQREETISCPFECEYLQLAHLNEPRTTKDPAALPNRDAQLSHDFLEKHVELVITLQQAILVSALSHKAIDNDAKEALDGLVRTYKTLQSGLVYESRPTNPMASAIYDAIQQRVAEIRQAEDERGVHKLKDSQIVSVLIFLQQMEYAFNNDRRRGRSFLHNLRASMTEIMGAGDISQPKQPSASPLIVT